MKMPNYQEGKIYKIVNDVNDQVYIGSTTQALIKRFRCHCSNAKNSIFATSYFYDKMREIGIQHFRIELIKLYPCASKEKLETEEFRVSQEMDSVRNGYNSKNGRDWCSWDKNSVDAVRKRHHQYHRAQLAAKHNIPEWSKLDSKSGNIPDYVWP
jgi:hypothetical protein